MWREKCEGSPHRCMSRCAWWDGVLHAGVFVGKRAERRGVSETTCTHTHDARSRCEYGWNQILSATVSAP